MPLPSLWRCFVKFKASLCFSKEKGFLTTKVQPLWRFLKPRGLKNNPGLFPFLIPTCTCVLSLEMSCIGSSQRQLWGRPAGAKSSLKRKKGELIKMSGAEPDIFYLISHWIITARLGKYYDICLGQKKKETQGGPVICPNNRACKWQEGGWNLHLPESKVHALSALPSEASWTYD